jgi:hypothetical protein
MFYLEGASRAFMETRESILPRELFAKPVVAPLFQTHPPAFIDPSSIVLLPGVYLDLEDGTHAPEEVA